MNNLIETENVVCRPALRQDTAQVLELCSHIWEGDDYIPYVWDKWMADPEGMLGVAELQGRVVGIFKLSKYHENEWWMAGLRVHPDFQGTGIASHIHTYVVETWRKLGGGIVRLTTASYNIKVHHMCEEGGFKRIGEFIPYRAPVAQGADNGFTKVALDEAPKVLEFISESPLHALSAGMINWGWVFGYPRLSQIQEAIGFSHAWWWRDGTGFISIFEDDEDGEPQPGVQLLACSLSDLAEMLKDYRLLMGEAGYKTIQWMAPNHPQVISSLEKSGFERAWDKSLYLYELRE